jgi:predicted DNA-binding protein
MRDERQYGDAIRIRFRPEQLKALDLMAERVGNTRSGLVRHLVAKSIAEASK